MYITSSPLLAHERGLLRTVSFETGKHPYTRAADPGPFCSKAEYTPFQSVPVHQIGLNPGSRYFLISDVHIVAFSQIYSVDHFINSGATNLH